MKWEDDMTPSKEVDREKLIDSIFSKFQYGDSVKAYTRDIVDKFMTVKCRHPECFGKNHPCDFILINKNEMNIVYNNCTFINNKDDEKYNYCFSFFETGSIFLYETFACYSTSNVSCTFFSIFRNTNCNTIA